MTSTIKVNTITTESGSTLTVGGCGKTVALASGASQTGFGRTGTVDWQTGDIKTTTFTAVNGQGFFVDTNGGAVTANLPAGSAGAIVSFQDYRNTFDTAALTVAPNGSEKINGGAGNIVLNTEGEGVTLVYIDSTIGWRSIQDNVFADAGSNFISATGGTESQSGDFKIHKFTGPGTFTVTSGGSPAGSTVLEYLVVGGGGAGGPASPSNGGGGGGAGGYRESNGLAAGSYTVSPLATTPTTVPGLTAAVGSFPIQVGGGGSAPPGAPGTTIQNPGTPSIFSTVTSAGGGGGAYGPSPGSGGPGGSGGGGGGYCSSANPGGSGNTPPVTPPQGNNGGLGSLQPFPGHFRGGGGGGALAVGTGGGPGNGDGGGGATSSIDGTPTARAGGGGAGCTSTPGGFAKGSGGAGGGGAGGGSPTNAVAGTVNTGGGGGGGGYPNSYQAGGAGGSGIVIIRYKSQ